MKLNYRQSCVRQESKVLVASDQKATGKKTGKAVKYIFTRLMLTMHDSGAMLLN
jgi:hypothetical protein